MDLFDLPVLLTGFLVFLARVIDVTLGTLRTISIVHGQTRSAFFLGFVEIILWLAVITTVVNQVIESPVLAFFYALGFATGNVVGIIIERRYIAGPIILRVLYAGDNIALAGAFEVQGFEIITFSGADTKGPVTELNVLCRRRDLKKLINIIKRIEPDSIYITEQAGGLGKILRPTMQKTTGWRSSHKRK